MVDCFKVITAIKHTHKMGELTKPVVIRMKGINAATVTAENKLPSNMQFIDDWEEATLKCIEIANKAEEEDEAQALLELEKA
jgi:hypothetical protein